MYVIHHSRYGSMTIKYNFEPNEVRLNTISMAQLEPQIISFDAFFPIFFLIQLKWKCLNKLWEKLDKLSSNR